MELFLSEIEKPFMCLNMIVKNESHIIKDSLTKLLNKIKIDYWVISDTGSTDNTKQIINEFFQENGIQRIYISIDDFSKAEDCSRIITFYSLEGDQIFI